MTTDLVTVYAVYWPDAQILKVGRTRGMRRIRSFTNTGARVLLLMRGRPAWEETAALAELDATFDRAFAREWDSTHILPRGRGFTECFTVAADQVDKALRTIFRGIARYGNQQAEGVATGDVHRRDVESTRPVGAVDGDRVAVARRRSGAGEREPKVVVGVDLAVVGVGAGGGHRRSLADVGGGRVYRPVCGREANLLLDARLAEGRPCEGVAASASTSSRIHSRIGSRIVRGWGERGRERECRAWRPLANASRRFPFTVLSGTPGRDRCTVPQLRDCTAETRTLGRRAAGRGARGCGGAVRHVKVTDLERTALVLEGLARRQEVLAVQLAGLGFEDFATRSEWLISQRSEDERLSADRGWERLFRRRRVPVGPRRRAVRFDSLAVPVERRPRQVIDPTTALEVASRVLDRHPELERSWKNARNRKSRAA